MSEIIQNKEREFEGFANSAEIVDFLKTKFQNMKFRVSYDPQSTEVIIVDYLSDDSIMIVTDVSYMPEEMFTIYGLADKYIEIDLELNESDAPGRFRCLIKAARKAAYGRKELRLKLEPDDASATNFRIADYNIDISGFKIPTTVKVVLDQFKSFNSKMADIVNVDVFKSNETDTLLGNIKKTGKNVLITDTADKDSYKAMNDNFVDVSDLFGKDFPRFMKFNSEKGYKSIAIAPLIYVIDQDEALNFGYIRIISKNVMFDVDTIFDLKEKSFDLIGKIQEANTKLFNVRQQIVDISRHGIKIKITEPELKNLLSKIPRFVFDILFKLQAPITIDGIIEDAYKAGDDMFIGVAFSGNSSRKDEIKRLYEILHPMESAYRANLIKSLKK
ncbi:MAG: DUF1577 domain-containing protein [Leptospirales bacterium]|nr:DUF1577 domain-containing protein [Leptospirales bacterium]